MGIKLGAEARGDGGVRTMARQLWLNRFAWFLQILLASIFVFTSWRKFTAHPIPLETVEALGAGQWLRIALGIAELAGAAGLLIPRLTSLAAACLALLMLGAAGTHVFIIGGSPALAIALMLASAVVVWIRLKQGANEPA